MRNDQIQQNKKGVYLCGYIDSFKEFSQDELPDRCNLFSFLKHECLSEKHVLNVFKVNVVGGYHDLYLKQIFYH